jgi:hypothetical protein
MLVTIVAITAIPAFADTVPGHAVLAGTANATVVAPNGAWHCTANACSGPTDTRLASAVADCTAVADGAGRVAAFTAGSYAFADADLTRCNRHLKPAG